jgi:CHASE2 domain-containing sensor protein
VKGWATKKSRWATTAAGAALAVLTGLLLWAAPLGASWNNASYDYLFRFGTRAVTNRVSLVLMDNGAFDHFGLTRGKPWDRALHAQLLNRLADDGCALVVIDAWFHEALTPAKDDALAAALRRQKHVVLMAQQTTLTGPGIAGATPLLPAPKFLEAASTNWGVAWLDPDLYFVVRRHWPFYSAAPYPSLPWAAARQLREFKNGPPMERWLRYYGANGPAEKISYQFALAQPAGYYRDRIVFIGNWPETALPGGENDKFSTPYTRWTGEAVGGVEILLTEFLNLLNGESLVRPPPGLECALLLALGAVLGGGLCRLPFRSALPLALVAAIVLSSAAITLSYFTCYWFPWLVVVGGQLPCALGWALITSVRTAPKTPQVPAGAPVPNFPGYELVHPPFGEGAYGKVWLARGTDNQWRALKAVYLAEFDNDPAPYEREFSGIKKYQPLSALHPGLLRVDFVSEKLDGYFYYVMELADAIDPIWTSDPAAYKPRDLVSERARLPKRRLPVRECLRVGILLSDALEFLHRRGLTHRDIKPQNIIFVAGQPKLADLGLLTEIRPDDQERTLVGTPGFMPPLPERPGTVAADLYAFGMVLYVVSTGRNAALFPELATTLVSAEEPPEFLPLNEIILKACQPLPTDRYTSAAEMGAALKAARDALESNAGPAGAA